MTESANETQSKEQTLLSTGKRSNRVLNKTALVVLGMHRSGTSAVTRALGLLGASLPENLMPPTEHNPEGYWESLELVKVHDEMLHAADLSWHDTGPIPAFWENSQFISPYRNQITETIKRNFGDSSFFVVKDPRIARFVPVTVAALREVSASPKFIITLRNPLEVAASLKMRDGFRLSKSLLLWLDHTLQAEWRTRAFVRSFVLYEEFLQDWRGVLRSVARDLDITFPSWSSENDSKVDSSVNPALRHHSCSLKDVQVREDVAEWVKESFTIVRALAHDDDDDVLEHLDRIRTEFETAQLAFCPLVAEEQRSAQLLSKNLGHVQEEAKQLAEKLNEQELRTAKLEEELKTRDDELETYSRELTERETAAKDFTERLREQEARADKLEGELRALDEELKARLRELAERHAAAKHAAERAREQETRADELEGKLNTRDNEVEGLSRELSERDAAAKDFAEKLRQQEIRADGLEEKLKTKNEKIAALSRELIERDATAKEFAEKLEAQEVRYRAIERQSALQDCKVQEFKASLSWRVTAPLRMTLNTFLMLGSAFKTAKGFSALSLSIGPKAAYRLFMERRFVLSSSVFDVNFYLRRNSADIEAGVDPVLHYLRFGAEQGLDPNPLFDTDWYLEQNPDVRDSGINPLIHYLQFGASEGRDPNPLFDTDWYLEQNPDVANSGINPLIHYLNFGSSEYRDPNPFFDTNWYLKQYRDVAKADVDPLIHFIEHGWREGRNPSAYFDTAHYIEDNKEIKNTDINPLAHYLSDGTAKKQAAMRPNPVSASSNADFVCQQCRSSNMEERLIDSTELEILISQIVSRQKNEAIKTAQRQNRNPAIDGDLTSILNHGEYIREKEEILDCGLWDEKWYREQYRHEFAMFQAFASKNRIAVDALDHYMNIGWRKGFQPSKEFRLAYEPFPKSLDVNHLTYFLRVLRYAGYHFATNPYTPSSEKIRHYRNRKLLRTSRKVIYTCIVSNYNELLQPYCIDDEWDYVCFTDQEKLLSKKKIGVWDIEPLNTRYQGNELTNRWHKLHPHVLFPDYDYSIYVDGNINIIGDYIYRITERVQQAILLPVHFCRKCVFDEIKVVLASDRFTKEQKAQFISEREFLKDEGFPEKFGLSENNIIVRRHHDPMVKSMMSLWWWMLATYSHRDQLSISYCFWRFNLDINDFLIENARVNYKNLWLVAHNTHTLRENTFEKIKPAFTVDPYLIIFSVNDSFYAYLKVAIESLIAFSAHNRNYDIVVLYSNLSERNRESILELQNERQNISIRFFDMEPLISQIGEQMFPVDGYVPRETYNKCFLSDIFQGYSRCVYLDSDILIQSDIAELHDIDLEGKSIAACPNIANINAAYVNKRIKGKSVRDYIENDLGVKKYDRYFQAGVLVIDLKRISNKNLLHESVNMIKRLGAPIFYDQCVFNSIFYNDVKFISTAWNYVWYIQDYSYLRTSVNDELFFDFARSRLDPKIIHYASSDKYYNKPEWKFAREFWEFTLNSSSHKDVWKDCKQRLPKTEFIKLKQLIKARNWPSPKLLIHLHLFYRGQLPYFLEKLSNISGCNFELYVTQPQRDPESEKLIKKAYPNAKILTIGNVGYDIYPFLVVLDQVRITSFDLVLKLHTKNDRTEEMGSVYGVDVKGSAWRDSLVNAILGDGDIFRNHLERFMRTKKKLGCVGAEKFIFSTRKNNEERNYNLPYWKARFSIIDGEHYIGGSMFLARAFPFARFDRHGLTEKHFQSDSYRTKDYKNLAHVFERLFGLAIEAEGLRISGGE